jgi:hypothetical protein
MTASYTDSIFVNCPFDDDYGPLLRALVFTVYRCGFVPRSALEEDDGSEIRMDKIVRLIRKCKYGIHDISRTELDTKTSLPRFNMPFELGIFWGSKKFGGKLHKEKNALILEKDKYSYQKYLSDLNGVDVKAHANKPDQIVLAVRNWLHTASGRKTIPSAEVIRKNFDEFMNFRLPVMLETSHTELKALTFNDYCQFVEAALREKLDQS